jgi:hypothetical protein
MLSAAIMPGIRFQRVSRLGIEPRARVDAHRGLHAAVLRAPLRIEIGHDGAHVAGSGAGGVGVAGIHDELDGRVFAGLQLLLEARADVDHEERVLRIDDTLDVGRRAQGGGAVEHAGAIKLGDQRGRGCAVALVEQRVVGAIEVVGGRIAEQQALHDRGHDQDDAAGRILEHGEELLAAQVEDAQHGVDEGSIHGGRAQSSVLRVVARATPSSSTA